MRSVIGWVACAGLIGGMAVGVGGCGGDDFGTTVSLPADQRHKLPDALEPGTVIKLPSPTSFNIHDKRWQGTPGPDGKANPSADATPKGTAHCKADGSNGGVSSAEFQLGHCIDNPTDKAVKAEIKMTIDYEHACKAEGEGAKTVGMYSIKAFVKDTAGRILQTMPLSVHTSDDGQVAWSGKERTVAEVTFQPGLGYYIVLAGRAEASSLAKTSSSASVNVKSFELQIICKSATTTGPTAKGS